MADGHHLENNYLIFNVLYISFHLYSVTAWVRWYEKGGTILDFNEAKYDGVAVASAGP